MSHIPMAGPNMSEGALNDLEYRAKALVNTIDVEIDKINVEERKAIGAQEEERREQAGAEVDAKAASNAESEVYFNVGLEAMGSSALRMVNDLAQVLTDSDPGKFSIGGVATATMESDVKKMFRKPGLYAASGAGESAAEGMSLTERCNLAASSIQSQGECDLKTWTMNKTDMPSTELQRRLIYGQELASKAALESVVRARQQPSSDMAGPGGMGGGNRATQHAALIPSLASGPKYSMDEDVEDEEMIGTA